MELLTKILVFSLISLLKWQPSLIKKEKAIMCKITLNSQNSIDLTNFFARTYLKNTCFQDRFLFSKQWRIIWI